MFTWLSRVVYSALPKANIGPTRIENGNTRSLLILSKHPNPTYSYYFSQRISELKSYPTYVRSIQDSLEDIDPDGLFIIVVRYITNKQLDWIEEHRSEISAVALFLDDDIPSIIAGDDASLAYKARLWRFSISKIKRLSQLLGHIWVSTEQLKSTIRDDRVKILPPLPAIIVEDDVKNSRKTLKISYHATGIHKREHDFLRPIIKHILTTYSHVTFEVIADGRVASGWKKAGIAENQLILKPSMTWPSYETYAKTHGADIALVPLLDTQTNRSRSDTKRIDVARLGAAAIYSKCPVFDRCSVQGEIHVQNTQSEWISAISRLIGDDQARDHARRAGLASLQKMRNLATTPAPLDF